MYLDKFIFDTDAVLAHAMKHPAMHPKKKPTVDMALKAVVASVEYMTAQTVIDTYRPILAEMFDIYELNNGSWEETNVDQRGEWESGMDDEVEKAIEPLTPILSADWLGRETIDTQLHVEGNIDKLLASLGKEVFKQLSYGKEPGQLLANAGITRPQVEAALAAHLEPRTETQKDADMEQLGDQLQDVLKRIHDQVGADFDIMSVTDNLEMVMGDDEVMAGGAAQRLGLAEGDIEALQLLALDLGMEAACENTVNALQNFGNPAMPDKPKRAAKTPATPATPKVQIEGFDGAAVCNAIKAHSAVKEVEFAASLGVSKGTFVNWTNGKTPFNPTAEQRETLRNRLLADVNGLYAALCMVDGVQVDRTFE